MARIKVKNLDFHEVNEYVRSHGIELPNGQVYLTKPMKVFKKVHTGYHSDINGAIANLFLPIGVIVNVAQTYEKKMRASFAICHSIYSIKSGKELTKAYSKHSSGFIYHPLPEIGRRWLEGLENTPFSDRAGNSWNSIPTSSIVTPQRPFASGVKECDSGVHFFVAIDDAKNYYQ